MEKSGEKMEAVTDFIFLGSKITADGDYSHEIKRLLLLGRKAMKKTRQHIKKQRHCFANKGLHSQSYVCFSSHAQMWELDHKEVWEPKNWCFSIVVLEKTFESPLDCKKIKPVNPKGNQPWLVIVRSAAEAEAPIFWLPDAKRWLIGKECDAGKYRRPKEKGWQRMRWLDRGTSSVDMNLSKLWEIAADRGAWPAAVTGLQSVGHDLATKQQQQQQQSSLVI